MLPILFFILLIFLISLILMLSCSKTDLPEDSDDKSEKTIIGRVITTITKLSSPKIPNKVTYKKGYLPRDTTGDMAVRVVKARDLICKNADKNGLCGGLDYIFGVGYRGACCDYNKLCCSLISSAHQIKSFK